MINTNHPPDSRRASKGPASISLLLRLRSQKLYIRLGPATLAPPAIRSTTVNITCLDLEGVLIPEIWINFAEKTGIDSLRATSQRMQGPQEEALGRR